ncbi:MAG: PqqD family protein [Clostridia bacterium]|nr:PqqD family protein [Clostridia bacterium]
MKLKDDFITQDIDGTQFLVAIGAEVFSGIVRSNKTAAFIVNRLQEETTEEKIVDAMCANYDAPRAVIAADVAEILGILRGINALEE